MGGGIRGREANKPVISEIRKNLLYQWFETDTTNIRRINIYSLSEHISYTSLFSYSYIDLSRFGDIAIRGI